MGQHASTPSNIPPLAYTADDITHPHTLDNTVLEQHPDQDYFEDRQDADTDWTQVTVSHIPQGKVTLTSMDLSGRSLIHLGPSIGNLRHLVKLDISYNQITTLPDEFGLLGQLRLFNASHNRLQCLPDSIGQLERLKALNVSYNALTTLPETMPKSLVVLIAHHNALTMVPAQLSHTRLVSLHLDNNPPLASIPVQVVEMPSIRKLVAQACGFPTVAKYPLGDGPLSLKEICARRFLFQQQLHSYRIPRSLARYLASAKTCSTCKGPYFEQCVTRGRMIERSGSNILIEYRLCSPHWNTEEERLLALFTQQDDVIESNQVDALAAEWKRFYKQGESTSSHIKKHPHTDDDGNEYYYCRLVPSHHSSSNHEGQPVMTIDTMIENEQIPRPVKMITTTYGDKKVPASSQEAIITTGTSSSSSSSAGLTALRHL